MAQVDFRSKDWLVHMAAFCERYNMKTFQIFLRNDVGRVFLGASPRPEHPTCGSEMSAKETLALLSGIFGLTTAGRQGYSLHERNNWRTDIPNDRVGPFGIHVGLVANGPGRWVMSCTITLTQDEVAEVRRMCAENHVEDVDELLDIARQYDYL